jgi:hypothetical protein
MKNKRKGMDLLFQFHLWHKLNRRIKKKKKKHKGTKSIREGRKIKAKLRVKGERCREGRGRGWAAADG